MDMCMVLLQLMYVGEYTAECREFLVPEAELSEQDVHALVERDGELIVAGDAVHQLMHHRLARYQLKDRYIMRQQFRQGMRLSGAYLFTLDDMPPPLEV